MKSTWGRSAGLDVPYTASAPFHQLAGSRRSAQGPECPSRGPTPPPQLKQVLKFNFILTIYAPVNKTATCMIFSGGQIHYEGG